MSPTKLLIGLSLLVAPVACGYGDRRYDYEDQTTAAECTAEPRQADLDTDEALESDPGDGVGVFVEYVAGGTWHVFLTCDTNRSGQPCYFDIVLQALESDGILSVSRENLESDDEISYQAEYVHVLPITDNDYDGFYVQTEPGATLSLDVMLDGVCASEFIYWVDSGEVKNGYLSSPMDLTPKAP